MAVKIYGDGNVSENLNADKVDSQDNTELLDRTNHTGVAPQSSVENLDSDLKKSRKLSLAFAVALG
jgi:hypothetical protein